MCPLQGQHRGTWYVTENGPVGRIACDLSSNQTLQVKLVDESTVYTGRHNSEKETVALQYYQAVIKSWGGAIVKAQPDLLYTIM
jgi:hypothetical protein